MRHVGLAALAHHVGDQRAELGLGMILAGEARRGAADRRTDLIGHLRR